MVTLSLINVSHACAQSAPTLSSLIDKDWALTAFGEKKEQGIHFTSSKKTYFFWIKGKREVYVDSDFYLCNKKETTFDTSKVGKSTEGKYIIALKKKPDGTERIDIYEIVTLTDSEMTLIYYAGDKETKLSYTCK